MSLTCLRCSQLNVRPTVTFASRVCLDIAPEKTQESTVQADEETKELAESMGKDLINAWPVYAFGFLITILLTFMMFCALERCALEITYAIMGLVILILVSLGLVFLYQYYKFSKQDNLHEDTAVFYLVSSIVCFVFALLFICIAWCVREKIKISALIIEAAADYITDMPSIFTIPLVMLVIVGIYSIYWIASTAYLSSIGNLEHVKGTNYGVVKQGSFVR